MVSTSQSNCASTHSRTDPLKHPVTFVLVYRPFHLQTISQRQLTARPAVACSRTQTKLPLDAASQPPRRSSLGILAPIRDPTTLRLLYALLTAENQCFSTQKA